MKEIFMLIKSTLIESVFISIKSGFFHIMADESSNASFYETLETLKHIKT